MARGRITKREGKHGVSYDLVVEVGTDPLTGKRRRKVEAFRGTKKDAEKRLAELIRAVDTGSYCDPGKLTVANYLRRWMDTHKVNLAPSTLRCYTVALDKHIIPGLGSAALQKLTPIMIQEFYTRDLEGGRKDNKKSTGRGLSTTTVSMHHRILRKALADAVRWQMIARNPADLVSPPKRAKKDITVPTEAEVKALLGAAQGEYLHMPIYMAVYTGMRLGEVLGLRWEDVDLPNQVISVRQSLYQRKQGDPLFKAPKTKGSTRTIDVGAAVVRALKAHKKEQSKQRMLAGQMWQEYNLVCCLQNGQPIHPPTVGSRIRDLANNLDAEFSFHDLRHFHASILLKQGVHPKIVSERLGHSQISITMDTYSHLLPNVQRKAADLLDEALA
ncbi:MAG: tyrosine-type recombinase/integrase [Eubacteriales bacterium]|nr:tyrosine-type recombinase/integrase [Eubacteriales bacterium]